MNRYFISIELLSDLCVSDGGIYNSLIDIDICYDKYGLPYIPAKRLKGCLREAAQELNDWGSDIRIDKIFGIPGAEKESGNLKISNAYIKGYLEIIKEIRGALGHPLYHPQNVLNNYTYIRTQTSINYDTGIADDTSLRTMRVAKKGLVFEAEIELCKDYYDSFKDCVATLTNIGMSRTRGLGEIKATLSDSGENIEKQEKIEIAGCDFLEYEITLDEPMITLSASGSQEDVRDYIEGSSILGLVLSRLDESKKDTLLEQLNNMKFSNAYISEDGNRFVEVPAYISSIKNNNSRFINNLFFDMKNINGRQINSMKHTYVLLNDGLLKKNDVKIEERYHHRRSDDKSLGRAQTKSGGNSDFYQIASIDKDQTFKGYIYGTPVEIAYIYDALLKNKYCRIGYGRSTEYGAAQISMLTPKKISAPNKVKTDRVVLTLTSPVIIYNNQAMYSVSVDDLLDEFAAALDIDLSLINNEATKKYIKYISVSGYNVTWNKRKPNITAFDKGSSIDIHFNEAIDIEIPKVLYLGERSVEGYGECNVEILKENGKAEGNIDKKSTKLYEDNIINIENCSLGTRLVDKQLTGYIKGIAISKAKKEDVNDDKRATVSNMILMCSEFKNITSVKEAIDKRYKEKSETKNEKKKIAYGIIETIGDIEQIVKDYEKENHISGYKYDANKLTMDYLRIYLRELKYRIRNK